MAIWLEKHPEVHTVSRDRASAYALGIRKGAPQAVQVANRLHLLVNLRDAPQRSFHKHSAVLKNLLNKKILTNRSMVRKLANIQLLNQVSIPRKIPHYLQVM